MELFGIVFGAIFINNFVLVRFLGICPYLGVSRRIETAMGMGLAVIFVMTIASFVTYFVYHLILIPFNLGYLYIASFILVIAVLVQLVEMVIQKQSPALHRALGIYLPLVTTNCAILGVAFLNIQEGFTLVESTLHGFGAGIGFTLAIILFAGLRERLDLVNIPESLKGAPIGLIVAGLLSIGFMGFVGMI
ncbi:MAG: Electron transport complex subunit RsxA [Firmicutes bacterium]|nr:Electron transport complex subunit RsxA [Bacillota bacterium]